MIFDFEQANKKLDCFKHPLFKEVEPIGYSQIVQLPIRHFTYGNGNKRLVVTGCHHANEIITTEFILKLIEYLIDNNIEFPGITIDFIPILNPEGYLTITSAIRKKISKKASNDEIKNFCHYYYKAVKRDADIKKEKKDHQLIFSDVTPNCILELGGTNELKDQIEGILNRQPKGSIIDWAANGNGIDLNANSKYYKGRNHPCNSVYSNIDSSIPAPIGYGGKTQDLSFKHESESRALIDFLNSLIINGNRLLGFFNYHSVGGVIYQAPAIYDSFNSSYNYLLSKIYQHQTIKINKTDNIKYGIKEKDSVITSLNDELRLAHPGNLLIELSPMSGNPIGPYGDLRGANYVNTIQSNIDAFIDTLKHIEEAYIECSSLNTSEKEMPKTINKAYARIRKKD